MNILLCIIIIIFLVIYKVPSIKYNTPCTICFICVDIQSTTWVVSWFITNKIIRHITI